MPALKADHLVAWRMSYSPAARHEFADYTKGLLILFVVWGHSIQYLAYPDERFWSDPIFKLIYSFHMPLFMALSGYLTFDSIQRQDFARYLWRRFQQLIVPIVCWGILHRLVLHVGFLLTPEATNPPSSLLVQGQELFLEICYRFWFLWAVFFAAILTAVMHRWKMDRSVGFIAVTLAAWWLLPNYANLPLTKNVLPYFFIGYGLARIRGLDLLERISRVWLWFGLAATLAVWLSLKPEHHIYLSGMALNKYFAPIIAFRLASAVIVSFTFLLVAQQLYRRGYFPSLLELGRCSLGIYLLQTFVFVGLRWVSAPINPQVLALLLALPAAVVICLGLGWLTRSMENSRLVSRLLLGRVRPEPA